MAFYRQRDKPLFEDIIWTQPQRSAKEAQVLIIGGHSQSIQAPLAAFQHLKNLNLKASVILPDSLKKIFKIGKSEDLNLSFLPSTPAGSLAQKGAPTILQTAQKHACLFIAGDLSSNQETERLILELLKDFRGCKLVVGKIAKTILENQTATSEDLNLVLDASQLPFLNRSRAGKKALQTQASPEVFAQTLSELDLKFNLTAATDRIIWTKIGRDVCATFAKNSENADADPLKLAAHCALYLINNPRQPWPASVSAAWQALTNEK